MGLPLITPAIFIQSSLLKTSVGRIVAALATSTSNADILKHKVRAVAITRECSILAITHSTSDMGKGDVLGLDAVGRLAGRTAIQ